MNIRRRLAAGLLLLPLAFVSAACVGVTRPQGWASPAIDGSSAFILEDKDRLTALELSDSNTANVRWSFPDDDKADQQDIDLEAIYAQPQVDGDVLYTVGYSGELVALDVESGDLVRIRDFPGNVAGNLVLDNGQIALATTEGHLYLVNADNFTPADGWDQAGVAFNDDIWADPVVTADHIFVATMEGDIMGVDRKTGEEVWRHEHDGAIPTLALLDESNLFAGSLSKDVMIIDPATGDIRTRFEAEDWVWNTPAFADGIAYFGDFSGKVYALDISTGQMTWPQPYDGGSKMKSGPVIIDDVLVVADRQPTVHFIRLSDGAGQNQVPLPEDSGTVRADLVLHEGKALVLTTDGRLFTADPSTAPGRVDEITYGGGQ